MPEEVIASNLCLLVPTESRFIFGGLQSAMHMAWVSHVCGRLESRFRYSNKIVYNNFPWPKNPDAEQAASVEKFAQSVLDVRSEFPNATLADLYDPSTMPPKLVKAHRDLDLAVDRCYRKKKFENETERLEFLFEMYKELIESREVLTQEKKTLKKKTL